MGEEKGKGGEEEEEAEEEDSLGRDTGRAVPGESLELLLPPAQTLCCPN